MKTFEIKYFKKNDIGFSLDEIDQSLFILNKGKIGLSFLGKDNQLFSFSIIKNENNYNLSLGGKIINLGENLTDSNNKIGVRSKIKKIMIQFGFKEPKEKSLNIKDFSNKNFSFLEIDEKIVEMENLKKGINEKIKNKIKNFDGTFLDKKKILEKIIYLEKHSYIGSGMARTFLKIDISGIIKSTGDNFSFMISQNEGIIRTYWEKTETFRDAIDKMSSSITGIKIYKSDNISNENLLLEFDILNGKEYFKLIEEKIDKEFNEIKNEYFSLLNDQDNKRLDKDKDKLEEINNLLN